MPVPSERRFRATIAESGARAFVELPFDPDEAWGAKDRHYVDGHVGGRRIRGVLAPTALGFVLPLGPSWRRDNGLAVGATVDVLLAPEGPLVESLDRDVAEALAADAIAGTRFRSIAPFYRKNFVRWITGAKRPETRAARIAEMVKALAEGRQER
jgi:hypothetical protein